MVMLLGGRGGGGGERHSDLGSGLRMDRPPFHRWMAVTMCLLSLHNLSFTL